MSIERSSLLRWWPIPVGLGLTMLAVYLYVGRSATAQHIDKAPSSALSVSVVRPLVGGSEHISVQPGSVHAFESQEVYAKVPGYLINQQVDMGDVVKKGQVLAEINAPELFKEAELAAAQVRQAEAKVKQGQAHVEAARAQLHASKQLIVQRKAEQQSAESFFEFRTKQHKRYRELALSNAVDQRLVDEDFEKLESARSSKDAAVAAVDSAIADVEAKVAHVAETEADLKSVEASLAVANATLAKAQVFVDFTKIRSYYDGQISKRNFHDGAYIRTAEQGATVPLFTVERTDLMRVIVQMPDTDAPDTGAGDAVTLKIVTLPNVIFKNLRVSRIANSQDDRSRTMRIEVDVPNPKGLIRNGMYAEVTIKTLPAAQMAYRVPSTCVEYDEGKASLQIVRHNTVVRQAVTVSQDDGATAEIAAGLQPDDLVVLEGNVLDGVTLEPSHIHLRNSDSKVALSGSILLPK